MSVEQNKATLRRFYDSYFNRGDLSAWNDMVDQDYVMHIVGTGDSKGLEGAKQTAAQRNAMTPNMRVSIDEMVAEGDTLAVRGEFTGTYTGEVQGVKVAGKKYTRGYAAFYLFKNGKIAKGWTVQDMLGTAQQLGITPPVFKQSEEKNKASMRRCFEEIWNKGNLAVIPEVISPDYVGYNGPVVTKGLAAFEQSVKNMRAAFPDLHYVIDSAVGEGDTLAIRLTLTGTFKGKMGNIEPTGKSLDWKQVLFNRYVDGKCVEATSYGDSASLYRQLGIPAPAG